MAYKDPNDPRNKEARLRHYHKNKEKYIERSKAKRQSLNNFMTGLKSYPCQDCDSSFHFSVMDLDHRPGEIKKFNPGQLKNMGSWSTLIDEIMKCDLVCANCHRLRTYYRSTN